MSWLRGVTVPAAIPDVDLISVCTLLSWPEDGSELPLVSAISLQYVSRVSRALGAAFASITRSDHPRSAALRDVVADLPNESFFRLVVSPEIFAAVAGTSGRSSDELVEFFIESVATERLRAADVGNAASAAPRIPGGPPIDAVSPSALRLKEPRCGPALPWTDAQVATVRDQLEEAFNALGAIAPAAQRLVRDFTRMIVVRREDQHPDVFRSSSTNGAIGRTLLVNPGLAAVTTLDLADALMHEAIHHSLYMAELSSPMVLDSAACAEIRPLSPWTGNPLTVHSYLHACLVWFGLLRLWSRPGAEQFGVEAVGARLEVLRGGFARGSLVTPIADALPGLAPWVPALLEELLEAASA